MMLNEETMEAPKPTLASVLQRDNLNASWRAVKANRGAAGPDGKDIPTTLLHLTCWSSSRKSAPPPRKASTV